MIEALFIILGMTTGYHTALWLSAEHIMDIPTWLGILTGGVVSGLLVMIYHFGLEVLGAIGELLGDILSGWD